MTTALSRARKQAVLTIALFLAPLLCADDHFLKWMDRIAQDQLTQREVAVAKIQTLSEAESRKGADGAGKTPARTRKAVRAEPETQAVQ